MEEDFIRSEFTKIADTWNWDYQYAEKICDGVDYLTVAYHTLFITYKNILIHLEYEFGDLYKAEVKMQLPRINPQLHFSLKKKSFYKLFFTRDKKSLKVESESTKTQTLILRLLKKTGLETIA